MRYGSLIVLFVVVFTGCKSDKVKIPEPELAVPKHLIGLWDAKSAIFGQGFDDNTNNWSSFPTYNPSISSSPYAFHIEIKENKILNIIFKKKVIESHMFKVIQFVDTEMCHLTHIQFASKKDVYLIYTKQTSSLSSEYEFMHPETFNCVNKIGLLTYYFKKI